MQTRQAAGLLKQLSLLMELHGENSFKAKAIGNASFRLGKSGIRLDGMSLEELEKVDGIGKSIASKLIEINETGSMKELDELLSRTPVGVVQMLGIKGIGPKKVHTLWKDLGAESLGELLYACNENRLSSLSGFGLKTQEEVRKSVEFTLSNSGKIHFASAEPVALELELYFKEKLRSAMVSLTGAFRRRCEILDEINFLIACEDIDQLKSLLVHPMIDENSLTEESNRIVFTVLKKVKVEIEGCTESNFIRRLFESTGSKAHLDLINYSSLERNKNFENEESIYSALSLPFIIPEMREGLHEVEFAKSESSKEIIESKHLLGILHNHTSYSDGLNTLEEMAMACKDLGYQYLGICDHSQTAVYAGGLKPEAIVKQQKEIMSLNEKLKPFKIFKGIESDILGDGSLDYSPEILKSFDFIVASIHSNLKMTKEKATDRLMRAIENPFTTILGHPTGRLLLAREAYPIDHEAILQACAKYGVIIELNAHPYRLDLDWRWIHYATKIGVKISINPDAHSVNGYHDMHYGVCVARKAGLQRDQCFNALSLEEIEKHFLERKR